MCFVTELLNEIIPILKILDFNKFIILYNKFKNYVNLDIFDKIIIKYNNELKELDIIINEESKKINIKFDGELKYLLLNKSILPKILNLYIANENTLNDIKLKYNKKKIKLIQMLKIDIINSLLYNTHNLKDTKKILNLLFILYDINKSIK
jgi:hypothetical protein